MLVPSSNPCIFHLRVRHWSARRSSLKERERAIVSQTNIRNVLKATLGKLIKDGVKRIWAFPSAYIPSRTELNWTEVKSLAMSFKLFALLHLCWTTNETASSERVFQTFVPKLAGIRTTLFLDKAQGVIPNDESVRCERISAVKRRN